MKRAFITGMNGFVGRHMRMELEGRGWDVRGCDIKSGIDALNIFNVNENIYNLVVHAAYHVGGRAAIDGVPDNLLKNIQLDSSMFEWAVRTKQRRVLYFSSSAAYPVGLQMSSNSGRLFEVDIDHSDPAEADGRYGLAKLTGEQMAIAAQESGLPVTVVRPFSGYGADQDLTYPFPSFIDRARRREDPFTVWGSDSQVRDWIHITDVIRGALAMVDAGLNAYEPVNLCTGRGTSMKDLILMICTQAGYDPTITVERDKPMGVAHRVGDMGQMMQHYMPQVSLEEGIRLALSS